MPKNLDIAEIRKRLEGRRGPEYWRSLEQLAESDEFREHVGREFPVDSETWSDSVTRRSFLQLMGASLALAGVTGCTRQPPEKIVPYVKQPEEIVLGRPLFFATAVLHRGLARGVLVESHEGRPTKIEGNPLHPSSLGGSDAQGQAWVLGLYDPDRSQAVNQGGRIRPWSAFTEFARSAIGTQRSSKGAGLRILTETVTSPTLGRQIADVLAAMPAAKWIEWEPGNRDSVREGARIAFGEDVEPQYRFDQADVVLSLDADFLGASPGSLRWSRDFAGRRRAHEGTTAFSRLYVVESTTSITGGRADHRLPVKPSQVLEVARAVAAGVGVSAGAGAAPAAGAEWVAAVVEDLKAARGRSIVVAGESQPAALHALAHAMNDALGNVGATVTYTAPPEVRPSLQRASLAELCAEMDAGQVQFLLILGGNPVYDAPGDLEFAKKLSKVGFRAHLSLYDDETSAHCHWHLPMAHPLEAWSDARGHDGTATILQPLIAPLYEGRSPHELLSSLFEPAPRTGHDIVQETWKTQGGADFDLFWRRALHDGVVAESAHPLRTVALRGDWAAAVAAAPAAGKGVEVALRCDPTVDDGRFANNGWLQELAKPFTKITWDNVVQTSLRTAEKLGLQNGQMVDLTAGGRTVTGPVWVVPGQPEDALTVHLGYGRTRAGKIATGVGFDAYPLTSSKSAAFVLAEVRARADERAIARTQVHHSMEGRALVRSASFEEWKKHPDFAQHMEHAPARDMTLYPEWKYDGYAWAMAIDLSTCTGCSACVIACQSENNIPVVGKDQVGRGREMHWIRVDTYFKGEPDALTAVHHQPVPCMQCENAPCEVVCPVAATSHSAEGLNDMVYNRCVGTRYCSNNCPYKVRRFNFYRYSDFETEVVKGVRNPDVTVRSRGVMEKCTYCVQRINAAKIEAEKQDRRVKDGEITPACAQACPTQAIVFGDRNDPESRVAKLRKDPRNYSLLADLNTRPRTTYLADVRNPNPALAAPSSHGHGTEGSHS